MESINVKFMICLILVLIVLTEGFPWAMEREVLCRDPGQILNGTRSPAESIHSVGSVVHFQCVPGYAINGTANITCMSNGQWSGEVPVCQDVGETVFCKEPGQIKNGRLTSTNETYSEGAEVSYQCLPGFKIQGEASLTCTHNGTWSNELPECKRKEVVCKNPGRVKNARQRNMRKVYSVGSRILYLCLSGYKIKGRQLIICRRNGKWSQKVPSCKRKEVVCKNPGRVKNSRQRNIRKVYRVGSRINYDCLSGYKIKGRALIICRRNGKWSHKVPSCEKRAILCKDPGKIKHGRRRPRRSVQIRKIHRAASKIVYRCYPGYKINGTASITCQNNGSWSNEIPTCQPISCGKPFLTKHGNYTGNDFTYPSVVTYKCDVGYKLIGKLAERRCRSNGKWTKKPRCEIHKCRIKGTLRVRHGKIKTTDKTYSHGATLLFNCNNGYELVGTDSIACLEGKWSARRLPYCKVKACPNPGFPDNGRRIGNNFRIGYSVRFTCQSGFKLTGSPVRTCLKNKQWSGSVAVCDDGSTDCPILGTPISGIKIGNRHSFGSTVRFECKEGFILKGSSIRRCTPSGKWNGTEANCVDEFQYFVKNLNDTAIIFRKNIDTLMEYTCSSGNSTCNISGIDTRARSIDLSQDRGLDVLFVFDASSSIKKREFNLAKEFAISIVNEIGATWKPKGTRIATIVYGTKPELVFNFGDHGATSRQGVVNKLRKIERLGGGTATRHALEMARKTVFVTTKSKRQRAMFFITDGRSNIGGKPEAAAKRLRNDYKVQITAIGVGKDVNPKELYAIGNNKEDVVLVKSYKELEKAIKKSVKIDYSVCGESDYDARGRMVGGNEAHRKRWPWQVGLHRVDNDDKLKLFCGGALIDKRWVLTAAHCFKKHSMPGTWTVKAGDYILEEQDTSEQEIQADDIFSYPDYDPENYKNDIALVKLRKDVKLGPFVRPVCLPKKNEELLEPGKVGFVAGWGVTQVLRFGELPSAANHYSKVLLQSAFKIQNDELCDNKAGFYFNPNVTFCAGDGKGGNDTCQGDSGGSFVRQAPRDHGQLRWVSAGLVSWGEGCGLAGKYGYYARVAPFVDWIEKEMREDKRKK